MSMIDDKVVYVAHPFNGDDDNIKKVENYLNFLREKHTSSVFISPLHCYSWIDYEKEDISICLRLLEKCELLLLTGDWRNSKGCVEEYYFAKENNITALAFKDEYFDKQKEE